MPEFLRLTDYALQTNSPRIAKTVEVLFDKGSVLARDIPFAVHPSIYANGARFDGPLPTPTWMDINVRDLPGSHSVPKPFQEQAYLFREMIMTDHALLKDQNSFQDPHLFSVRMFLAGVAFDFNDKFLNNTHTSTGDTKSIVGLRERLDKPNKYGTYAENKMDANGVDLTATSGTAKTFGAFCELLDELLYKLDADDGSGVVMYLPAPLMWRLNSFARQFSGSGGFGQATDQLGRQVMSYRGAQLRDLGRKADQSTPVMTMTETATGADGSSDFASIYAVKYGGDGLQGWTHLPLRNEDVNDENGTHKKTLIEWMGGIMCANGRSIGRLYNIKVS